MPDLLFEVTLLEKELQDLLAAYPELAEDEQLRADTIEGETGAQAVLSRIMSQALDAEAMAAAVRVRINALESRQAASQRRREAMRKFAQRLMLAGGLKSLRLPEATLSLSKGRDSIDITDEAALPSWAWAVDVVRKPSKTAIKEAIDAGVAVPGAQVKTGEQTLMVRT
jgi:hypothetical protein